MLQDEENKISKLSSTSTPERKKQEKQKNPEEPDPIGSQRVYKKTSSNQLLTLYLGTRELISRRGVVEPLRGVIYIDPKLLSTGYKIYGQLTLTFRYGREDEEVMGLKFCNEAVIALQQLWPKCENEAFSLSTLQEALLDRLGKNAVAFSMDVGTITPPSVQLLPAKRYTGAPIGTSYDIRVYTAEQTEDRIQRRSTVRLGIRLIHKICPEISITSEPPPQTVPRTLRLRLSPKARKLIKQSSMFVNGSSNANPVSTNNPVELEKDKDNVDNMNRGPQGFVDKPFLWAEGKVSLRAALNKSAYSHGENINVTLDVKNDSRKIVRKIRIFAVQHVDVCMFSNGKFKNIVAEVDVSKQVGAGESLHGVFSLLPVRGATKNWIAVEGALFGSSSYDTSLAALNSKLASSAPRGISLSTLQSTSSNQPTSLFEIQNIQSKSRMPQQQSTEDKNVFAIYVSYYIKVKLTLSSMGGEVTLKLPFILGNIEINDNSNSNIQINTSNEGDLHLNDHQTLNDIRRPNFKASESISDDNMDESHQTQKEENTLSKNSDKNCKSYDENEIIGVENIIDDGIEYINQKLSRLNRSDSSKLSRSDSSKSNTGQNEFSKLEVNVIQAQIHCQKSSDSDI